MAWDSFFQRYWPVVYAYARHRGCSEHTSEEIVQDVMLTVFKQRDVFRYDPCRGRFRDWLHRVTSNRIAQRRRRPAERVRAHGDSCPVTEPFSPALEPDVAWETAFEHTLLSALVDIVRHEFNPRDFVAFELTALGDLSPAHVARLLRVTRNMVYKARRRIVARLQQLAGDYIEEGQLCERIRQAIAALPDERVERAVTSVVQTIRQSKDVADGKFTPHGVD
jgi:RNA polymerase sigma-70 factor (ECF subfamily)